MLGIEEMAEKSKFLTGNAIPEWRIIRNTMERMEAGAIPPRQRKKWRTLIDALNISLTAGNRSVMNYWKAVSFVSESMQLNSNERSKFSVNYEAVALDFNFGAIALCFNFRDMALNFKFGAINSHLI